MSRYARFAFAAHPDALNDLRTVPEEIRDLALLELQHLVHGNERGAAMHRELLGCHKVYVDPQTRWRLVIQYRDAPASSQHRREIYLLAVGERRDNAVYRTAAARLERRQETTNTPPENRATAARARSPHLRATPPLTAEPPASGQPGVPPIAHTSTARRM
ncbi:type II toxin-antitoxin system RelE/ParE family toxin [Streptomyces sp. ST2-7A]|nr:hypothetical protein [Streptomyces sp. ST2-7A]MCE7080156.1 hypothetical protein [Streptomyces sp. ST2-7A]